MTRSRRAFVGCAVLATLAGGCTAPAPAVSGPRNTEASRAAAIVELRGAASSEVDSFASATDALTITPSGSRLTIVARAMKSEEAIARCNAALAEIQRRRRAAAPEGEVPPFEVLRRCKLLRNETSRIRTEEEMMRPESRITVVGHVARPGQLPFDDETLKSAIAAAGGLTSRFARSALLTRTRPDGAKSKIRIDLEAIMSGHRDDIPLEPGDEVFVQEPLP
ncbi:MAG: hypothetical protein HOW73_32640 [Polyangiaceae bacterium]|nr:hypothetical protein [Polyangiaceae bacterium]